MTGPVDTEDMVLTPETRTLHQCDEWFSLSVRCMEFYQWHGWYLVSEMHDAVWWATWLLIHVSLQASSHHWVQKSL